LRTERGGTTAWPSRGCTHRTTETSTCLTSSLQRFYLSKRVIHLLQLIFLLLFLHGLPFRRLLLLDPSPSLDGRPEVGDTVGWEDGASEFDIVVIFMRALCDSSFGRRGVWGMEENLKISLSIK
jgi:hypothetical protein